MKLLIVIAFFLSQALLVQADTSCSLSCAGRQCSVNCPNPHATACCCNAYDIYGFCSPRCTCHSLCVTNYGTNTCNYKKKRDLEETKNFTKNNDHPTIIAINSVEKMSQKTQVQINQNTTNSSKKRASCVPLNRAGCRGNADCCWNPCQKPVCRGGICSPLTCLSRGRACQIGCECCSGRCFMASTSPGVCQ